MAGPPAAFVGEKEAREPGRQLERDLLQGEHPARSNRTFHLELVAIEAVVPLQRLEDEEVDRKRRAEGGLSSRAERGIFSAVIEAGEKIPRSLPPPSG